MSVTVMWAGLGVTCDRLGCTSVHEDYEGPAGTPDAYLDAAAKAGWLRYAKSDFCSRTCLRMYQKGRAGA